MAVVNTFDKTNQTQKYKIGGKQNEKTRGNNRGFQKAGCGRRVEPHPQTLELVGYLIDAMERAYNHGYADGLADGRTEGQEVMK